jgi:ADP-ribose pyrophosphatase YjhB (NUDIX family)
MMLAEDVKYCPRCGTLLEPMERAGKIRPVCPSCEWIFFPDPKVAAGVLIQKDSKVLLVRRAIPPQKGLWTIPVGFVDAGEAPEYAAERECREETGLEVRVVQLIDVFHHQEHSRGAHLLIVYRGEIVGGELMAGDDVDRASFFSLDSLPHLAFSTTRTIIDRFF